MHSVSFPVSPAAGPLCPSDFSLLASRFKKVFRALVPTLGDVRFLSVDAQQDTPLTIVARYAAQTGLPQKVGDDTILFPMPAAECDVLVAEVSGLDPLVLEKASEEWLIETNLAISRELRLIKAELADPVTGLHGCNLFFETVAGYTNRTDLHLVLIEAQPPAPSPGDRFTPVFTMAGLLKAHNRRLFPLFHVGMAVFAVLVSDEQRDVLSAFCLSMITALKRNGCRYVRCGCSSMALQRPASKRLQDLSRLLIDEAWQALQVARRRGPYAFCDYDRLINPEHVPLRPLARSVVAKLQRRCRQFATYALIFFKFDYPQRTPGAEIVWARFETEQTLPFDDGYLVIREQTNAAQVKAWADTVIEEIRSSNGTAFSLSAGISCFPDHGRSVAEILNNTRKALLHASFFGPGSAVIFDAVSLNVSGDISFGEGDWTAAVKEYRRGLELTPDDINLLNSLGVTYALMNRTGEALALFDRVLAIAPDNFMALYNQGLGRQVLGHYQQAAASFTRACEVYDPADQDEASAGNDLLYQLGICFFQIGNYSECAEILEKWHARQEGAKAAGACCRYIGISHSNLQRWSNATRWLQLAVVYDEFDAESLSLLGELYLKLGEGNDIALRLTEKAVEIDGVEPLFLLRWGRALVACGHCHQAIEQFRRCAVVRKTKIEAWFELGNAYCLQGHHAKARRYLKKLVTGREVPEELRLRATTLLQENEIIR
jgi:tetratricopeptide (TPR) repeat protein